MQEIIKQWMDEVNIIIPSFFYDDQKIKDNLLNFVVLENVEWFNIALIYYQKPNATFVQSKSEWNSLIDDNEVYIKKGEKGIKILIPFIKKDENSLDWKSVTVWDVSQLQSKIMFEHISNLRVYTEELQKGIYQEIVQYDEMITFLLNKSQSYIPSCLQNEDILKYVKDCISYILSYYLNVAIDKEPCLVLENLKQDDYINLYASLNLIMKSLHIVLKSYFDDLFAREKERKEIEEAEKIFNMNIKQRIRAAKLFLKKEIQIRANDEI